MMRAPVLVACLAALGLAAVPGVASACLPPLPRSAEQIAAANLAAQTERWEDAAVIVEAEVTRSWTTHSAEPVDPFRAVLHVEMAPVRAVRGAPPSAPLVFDVTMTCGYGFIGPTDGGHRYVLYAIRSGAKAEDFQLLVPIEDVAHQPVLDALADERRP